MLPLEHEAWLDALSASMRLPVAARDVESLPSWIDCSDKLLDTLAGPR